LVFLQAQVTPLAGVGVFGPGLAGRGVAGDRAAQRLPGGGEQRARRGGLCRL
jgi:hypothetical protein